jgi:hypothetical protein
MVPRSQTSCRRLWRPLVGYLLRRIKYESAAVKIQRATVAAGVLAGHKILFCGQLHQIRTNQNINDFN